MSGAFGRKLIVDVGAVSGINAALVVDDVELVEPSMATKILLTIKARS
jgi:hypothetical protein